jgi:predicted Zn-dependent protease
MVGSVLTRAWRFGGGPLAPALALAGVILAGCVPAFEGGGGQSVSEASSPIAHAAILDAYGGVYRNSQLERTVESIVSRLIAASDDPTRGYAITILNAAAVNAFALPEGYLYVTRGLITLANDASELAAVLAHEMAHVTADHATERRNRALSAVIVGGAVQDIVQDPAAAQTAVTTSQETLAGFSRQQELEADLIGIRTVATAGYDPYAAARFLSSMSRFEDYRLSIGIRQDQRPAFLASHPANQARINAAIAAAQAFGPIGTGDSDRNSYLTSLNGVVFGDDQNQGFVRGRVFYHADLAIAFAVSEGFVLDNTQEAVLATAADGTALRFDAVGLATGQGLADYLRSGWVNGLDSGSIRDLTINGLAAASASAMAAGWHFRITVIRVGSATYRFIFANDANTAAFDQTAMRIADSFRELSPQEVADLRPLRIEIVTVGSNDNVASLAARMRGVDRPQELLLILNGIDPGTALVLGSSIKIATDF